MTNTTITVSADQKTATITIDLTQRHGRSASGKTEMVASTQGNKKIPGTEVVLGLNAYVK